MFRSRGEGGEAAFPEGDEGEQIVANVLLAAMVSQFYSDTAARAYVEYASALAKSLAQRSVNLPALAAFQIRSVVVEAEGKIETFPRLGNRRRFGCLGESSKYIFFAHQHDQVR